MNQHQYVAPSRRIIAVAALAVGLLLLSGNPAVADSTDVIGNPSGETLASECPDGTTLTGIRVRVESRNYVEGVAALCTDSVGTTSEAPAIQSSSPTSNVTSDSSCGSGDVANGLHGRSGDIVDAVGIGCEQVDGPAVGGNGGRVRGPFDCPDGQRLVGLQGTVAYYFGREVVSSVWGTCAEYPTGPTSKDDCKKGGWEQYGFRNQGQCVSAVATGGKHL